MTPNMIETLAALRAVGFMCNPNNCEHCKMTNTTSDAIDPREQTIRARGLSDGKAAGSWVIDGNTTKETARAIFDAIEAGDTDELPTLTLGQWADDPSWEEILSDEGIELDPDAPDEHADDLFNVYSDAWHEGMIDEVQRSARLAMPMSVRITCSDDDDGMCTVWCDDVAQAKHDQSISLDGQSSNWEYPDGEIAICSLGNFYDLAAALEAEGYEVDSSEYSAPDDEDLAYWAYKNECECAGTDPLDRDEWLETRE